MARGQAQAADTQLGKSNAAADTYGGQASQLYSALQPAYTQESMSQGYDPATKAAITNSGMGAIGASIGGTAEDASRRAARTRNPSGVSDIQDALSQNKALAEGSEAGNIQKQFADYQNQQRQAGLSGLMGLHGLSADEQAKLLALGPSTLDARAAGPSGAQDFSSILTALKPTAGPLTKI